MINGISFTLMYLAAKLQIFLISRLHTSATFMAFCRIPQQRNYNHVSFPNVVYLTLICFSEYLTSNPKKFLKVALKFCFYSSITFSLKNKHNLSNCTLCLMYFNFFLNDRFGITRSYFCIAAFLTMLCFAWKALKRTFQQCSFERRTQEHFLLCINLYKEIMLVCKRKLSFFAVDTQKGRMNLYEKFHILWKIKQQYVCTDSVVKVVNISTGSTSLKFDFLISIRS